MKHSVDELIDIAHRYYPRGMPVDDRYKATEESRRLVAARRRAGADSEPWRALLRRLGDQFPESIVQDRSSHLPTGDFDASYSGEIYRPKAPGEHDHTVGFLVSILVPYYIVYSARIVGGGFDQRESGRSSQAPSVCAFDGDTCFILPANVDASAVAAEESMRGLRQDIRFDLSSDEQPYAAWLARSIEATFGYARMPPEVGKMIVPEVSTVLRSSGEATLYDCLFSDNW